MMLGLCLMNSLASDSVLLLNFTERLGFDQGKTKNCGGGKNKLARQKERRSKQAERGILRHWHANSIHFLPPNHFSSA